MDFHFDIREANTQALSYVRKESLDIFNRLHSIMEDVQFVQQAHEAYPKYPFLPNLRCGAWYVDPAIATHEPAYFKSTDGHFSNWDFNLRRPNLHLLPLIIAKRGLVLVDSTRAGKRIPDALSKTVPIWCAVINRAMLLANPEREDWDVELYCPPDAVSEQERSQIKTRLDRWAEALVKSAYCLPSLPLPLRPFWITPSTSIFPQLPQPDDLEYFPIICVSASKHVDEGVERRSNGFSYVQGSGDDHELWGMGLTPQTFWDYKGALLKSTREELPHIVASAVRQSKAYRQSDVWKTIPAPIAGIGGRLLIGLVSNMPAELPNVIPGVEGSISFVIVSANVRPTMPKVADSERCDRSQEANDGPWDKDEHVLRLKLAEGKKDQIHFLQDILPGSTQYIKTRLARGDAVCVCCETGKDASVGIALAALQLFFDDQGSARELCDAAHVSASKESIRTRLQWIIASRPQANPSRVTLKRVNEYLLSSPSFRRG